MFTNLETFECNTFKYFQKDMKASWCVGYQIELEQHDKYKSILSCNIYDDDIDYHVKLSMFCSHETKVVYIMDAFGFDQGGDDTEYRLENIADMDYYNMLVHVITQKVYKNWIVKVYSEAEFIVHKMSRRIIQHVVNNEKTNVIASLLPYDILPIIGKHMVVDEIDREEYVMVVDVVKFYDLFCTGSCAKINAAWFHDYAMFKKCV